MKNYYLHVSSDGEEHAFAKPPELPRLRVEILSEDERQICERAWTFDRGGVPIAPPSGLHSPQWIFDEYAPEELGSSAWVRVRLRDHRDGTATLIPFSKKKKASK
jgi:hypothetical protein